MAINSVLGKTKVSSALIQTSEARKNSGLIVWEVLIISFFVGKFSDSFIVGFIASFLVLITLIDTIVWKIISFSISLFGGYVGYVAFCGENGETIGAGLMVALFSFLFMLSWHHWSLASWRALSD
jgi:putative Mn2+ efflux pump MntP